MVDKEHSVELTKIIREEYERVKVANPSWTNAETCKHFETFIHDTLENIKNNKQKGKTIESNTVAAKSAAVAHVGIAVSSPIVENHKRAVGIKAKPVSKKSAHGAPKMQRRRSFGDERDKMPAATARAAAAIATTLSEESLLSSSQSQPVLAEVPSPVKEISSNMDCWDSVGEQPFCKLCGMAFKAPAFLERHIKYSDMHAKSLQKLSNTKDSTDGVQVEAAAALKVKQVEGMHYKLVYSGSKLFWRTQENVDIDIYHHVIPGAIEVVIFNEQKGKEYPRIYLDYNLLLIQIDKIVKKDVVDKVEAMTKEHQHDRFAKGVAPVLPDMSEFVDEARRHAFTTFILSRLQQQGLLIVYVSSTSDDSTTNIVIPIVPLGLIPIPINRRRKTNSDEINSTIKDLENDRISLRVATGKAERIADFVHISINLFKTVRDRYKGLSKVRRRWVFAIRKTILTAAVRRTRARIAQIQEERDAKKKAEDLSTSNRRRSVQRAKDH